MLIKPVVSVIIPSYNRIKYIEETISSVESQCYRDYEIIVVDDGSTDGSFQLLERFKREGRIKLYTHLNGKNLGQSASINRGIDYSTGSYIAILDSDDYFSLDKLARQVYFLERNPSFGMVYGQGQAVDADGRFLFTIPDDNHIETNDPNNLLLDCYMALPGGSLIRRSVFDKVGRFEESFRAGQDHDMALRIMEEFKVAFLPEIVFYYRKHGDSISTNGLETRWRTGIQVLERAKSRYPYRKSTIRKRKAVINYRLGQVHWCRGQKLRSLGFLIMSGTLDPVRASKVLLGSKS
ncbi:glycosyltransferase [Marinobacter daepoensis]|uniref:glycosyltransferase family 2 protein n=1 Tax=Marinobacter daepoensis TaxID=262077 RepID=UPI001C97FAD5|nr:glycosyltransferase [Marinobacter daepoensis]MBY6032519.1 glycosyltransferase [Marinobacter daepoensis]